MLIFFTHARHFTSTEQPHVVGGIAINLPDKVRINAPHLIAIKRSLTDTQGSSDVICLD